jgi:hypothetical protein
MGFLGIKWQTPVKSGLVGTSTPRNDRQETLIKQNSLEYSPEVTNTHSATATAWTRPRSVTSIMRMRSCGRNDDKLLQLPNNEQQKAQVQEDTTSSQSSGSCGQQRDLAIAFVPYVRTNRNESKSNHHEEQFKSRYVVTSDLANAWVQMASPDTKTDPKSTTTTKAVKITAATAATTAAPTTLRRSCIVAPKKRTVGGRRTRRQDPENRNDVQTTNSLARNGTGRSLLSSVGAFVLRLGGQCGSESVKGVLQSQHDGKKESTTASSTPSTDIIQDRHLNCLLATRSDHHRNKKTTTPEKSLDLSPSCLDLDSAALSSAQLQQHAASASTRGTATTATTSSTKTTRMPPESDSIEEITMLPNPSTTTKSAEIEITTAATSTAATTTTEKAKKDAPEGTKKSNKHDWKAAVDPKSGRTYYYHSLTRETQWSMPVEMASEEERAAMQEKEQKQKDFFAMMEANILKSISSGAFNNSNPDIINEVATDTTETDSTEAQSHPKEIVLTEALGRPPEPLPRPNNMVRTISTMDESVLKALIQHVPSYRNVLQTDDQEISFAPKPNEGMSSIGNGKNKGGHGKYGRNGGNKLLSIQEALENSWNQLDDSMSSMNHSMASMTMDGDDNNDKEKKINRRMGLSPKIQTSSMKRSVGSLLAGLPEDGDQNMNKNAEGGGDLYNGEMAMPTRRSFYGASLLDESCFELGFTEDEFKAMQGLAEMTDEIDNINDSDSSDDNDNNNTTKLNPLVEESDSNDYYNSNMNGSMGDFDFDLDDLDQDSESSSVHLESEQETGRDQAKTTATGLQRGASDGSLSFSVLDASSRGTDPAESRPTTSRGTTPRPVTVRPMSLRKVAPESSSPGMVKPEMQRRNTCNTLYVGSTMSEPDKDATIKVRYCYLRYLAIKLYCRVMRLLRCVK